MGHVELAREAKFSFEAGCEAAQPQWRGVNELRSFPGFLRITRRLAQDGTGVDCGRTAGPALILVLLVTSRIGIASTKRMMPSLLLAVVLLLAAYSPSRAQTFSCVTPVGLHLLAVPSPSAPEGILVLPGDFPGVSVALEPSPYSGIAYAGIDPGGNGVLLTSDGKLASVAGEQVTLVATCGFPGPSVLPARPLPVAPWPGQVPSEGNAAAGTVVVSTPDPAESIVVTDSHGRPTEVRVDDGRLPMLASEETARACLTSRGGSDRDGFLTCMVDAMANPSQTAALACVRENADIRERAACLAAIASPEAAELATRLKRCKSDTDDPDWDCLARETLSGQVLSAYECAASETDTEVVNECLAALGADADAVRAAGIAVECYNNGSGASEFALCALEQSGNNDVARAATCVDRELGSAEPSVLGVRTCYAIGATGLNAEQRIAAECAVSTGGAPHAFAACAGGRLTARELSKCFTEGVGGRGCFGPNNEIVKALRIAGLDPSDLTNPNGEVVKAWNTVARDLQHGLGENNDARKIARNVLRDVEHGFGPGNDVHKAICGLFGC